MNKVFRGKFYADSESGIKTDVLVLFNGINGVNGLFYPKSNTWNDAYYTDITPSTRQNMNFNTRFRKSVKIYLEKPSSHVILSLF